MIDHAQVLTCRCHSAVVRTAGLHFHLCCLVDGLARACHGLCAKGCLLNLIPKKTAGCPVDGRGFFLVVRNNKGLKPRHKNIYTAACSVI